MVVKLLFPFCLFLMGFFGIFFRSRNLIFFLIFLELMLLGANLNFLFFSVYLWDLFGQVFFLFVLSVAAAEVAVGLALLVGFYRLQGLISFDSVGNVRN